MFKVRSTPQLAAAVLASGCIALALGARAEAGTYSTDMKDAKSSVACESARQAAWFDRQRQLTDGDADPFQKIATPRECLSKAGANSANESAPGKEIAAVATAPQRGLSWDVQGSLNGR
jgi:hypothetical protein